MGVKSNGKFVFPGFCMIKTRLKGYQGWPEGGLRQDDDGEGEACKDHREGVPRCGFEEEHLRCVSSSCLSIFRETLTGLTVQNARQGSGRQFLVHIIQNVRMPNQ